MSAVTKAYPTKRTQLTNLIVHSTATLDPGATANWGSVSGDLYVSGNIIGSEGIFSNVNVANANLGNTYFEGNVFIGPSTQFYGNLYLNGFLTVSNLITALEDLYVAHDLDVSNLAHLSNLDVTNQAVIENLEVLSSLVTEYLDVRTKAEVYDINASNNYFLYGQIFTGGGGGGGFNPNFAPSITMLPGANITLQGGTINGLYDLNVANSYFENGNVFTGGTNVDWSNVPSFRMMSSSNVIDLNGATITNGTISVSNIITQTLNVISSSNLQGETTLSTLASLTTHALNVLNSAGIANLTATGNTIVNTLSCLLDVTTNALVVKHLANVADLTVSNSAAMKTLQVLTSAGISNLTTTGTTVLSALANLSVSNLHVGEAMNVLGNITVSGTSTLSNLLAQTANIHTLLVQGSTTLSNLTVTGGSNLWGNLTVSQALDVVGGSNLHGNLIVSGRSDFLGNVTMSNLSVSQALGVLGNLNVSGISSLASLDSANITVENANIYNLTVPGYSNLYGDVTIFSNLLVDINARVLGLLTANLQTSSINFLSGGVETGARIPTFNEVIASGNASSNLVIFEGPVGFITSNGVGIGTSDPGSNLLSVGSNLAVDHLGTLTLKNLNVVDFTGFRNVTVGNDSGTESIFISDGVGDTIQLSNRGVALGITIPSTNANVITVGTFAGVTTGQNRQSESAVAIGNRSGRTQDAYSTSFGAFSGRSQGYASTAIGYSAGLTQASNAIAIGTFAGVNQSEFAVALGQGAGYNQSFYSIAIGQGAGYIQDEGAIAIGTGTGNVQGKNSIVIGTNATVSSPDGTIVLNANGGVLDAPTSNAFYVNPVRMTGDDPAYVLGYTFQNEIVQSQSLVFPGQVSYQYGLGTTLSVLSSNLGVSDSRLSDAGGRFTLAVNATPLDEVSPGSGIYGIANVVFSNAYTDTPVVVLTSSSLRANQLMPFVQVFPGYFQVCTQFVAVQTSPSQLSMSYVVFGLVP